MTTRTRGRTTWVDMDLCGCLCGPQAKCQVGKWIGPTGIVGPMIGTHKGGHTNPLGRRKAIKRFPLYRQ